MLTRSDAQRGKAHPRDPTNRAGRIRVKYRRPGDAGEPLNPLYPTKKSLMRLCGQKVPDTDIRRQRIKMAEERAARALQLREKSGAAAGATGATGAGAGSDSKKAKKTKKKGKR